MISHEKWLSVGEVSHRVESKEMEMKLWKRKNGNMEKENGKNKMEKENGKWIWKMKVEISIWKWKWKWLSMEIVKYGNGLEDWENIQVWRVVRKESGVEIRKNG